MEEFVPGRVAEQHESGADDRKPARILRWVQTRAAGEDRRGGRAGDTFRCELRGGVCSYHGVQPRGCDQDTGHVEQDERRTADSPRADI